MIGDRYPAGAGTVRQRYRFPPVYQEYSCEVDQNLKGTMLSNQKIRHDKNYLLVL